MLNEFGTVFIYLVVGLGILAFTLALSWLLQHKNPTDLKLETYECGEPVEGPSWIQFNPRFYIIALIFLIFDVEVVFMFPWAVVYQKLGIFAFVEMVIFIVILLFGLVYAWKKGDLNWVKPKVKYARGRYANLGE